MCSGGGAGELAEAEAEAGGGAEAKTVGGAEAVMEAAVRGGGVSRGRDAEAVAGATAGASTSVVRQALLFFCRGTFLKRVVCLGCFLAFFRLYPRAIAALEQSK